MGCDVCTLLLWVGGDDEVVTEQSVEGERKKKQAYADRGQGRYPSSSYRLGAMSFVYQITEDHYYAYIPRTQSAEEKSLRVRQDHDSIIVPSPDKVCISLPKGRGRGRERWLFCPAKQIPIIFR
jgi:hypothetical protein